MSRLELCNSLREHSYMMALIADVERLLRPFSDCHSVFLSMDEERCSVPIAGAWRNNPLSI